MLTWLRSLFAAPAPEPTAAHVSDRANRELMARYDNAQTTQENARLWGLADGLSAKSANSVQVRRVLRNRSRYETANSSYLQGAINTIAQDLVGTGPTLQVKGPGAKQIEAAWASWAAAVRLPEKLKTLAKAKKVDGEGFLFLVTNPALNHSVKLYPRDVEADQVTTPLAGLSATTWVDGVVLDPVGDVAAFHLLKTHPGDLAVQNFNPLAFDTIAARHVIHWYRKDRPGQVRGVPETASTLDLWGEMRRYRKAVVIAAETAASFSAVLQTEAPADPTEEEIAAQGCGVPFDPVGIERGVMVTTPWGAKLAQLKAEHPTSTYDSFAEKLLGEACRGFNFPLNLALGTSQKFNFSSAKLDHLNYYTGLRVERADCECVGLDPLFRAWLDEAVMVPGLLPDGVDVEAVAAEAEWHWPGFTAIDPMTDAQADTERLATNHTKTYRQYFAEQGKDWQDEFEQLAAEKKRKDELGLTDADVVPGAAGGKSGDPSAPARPGQAADVQATALNGAQVTSLLLICDKLVAGQYTGPAAEELILGAFPGIPAARVAKVVSELKDHEPPEPEPPPQPNPRASNGAPKEEPAAA